MLDMGFAEDLETILSALPASARRRSSRRRSRRPSPASPRRHLRNPRACACRRRTAAEGEDARVRQVAYVVRRPDKLAALCRILDLEDGAATLVFARTRGEVDDLAEALSGRGHDAAALHGGLSQEQRDRIMERFRDGALDVLVATDVAARGLDIGHITHVVNFDVPSSPDTYVHRIGRTGRAGREGVAITLVEPREHRLLRNIERTMGMPLADLGPADRRRHARAPHGPAAGDAARGAASPVATTGTAAVVEALSDEFDLVDIALAAVSHADAEARGAEDTTELAPATLPSYDRPARAPGAAARERPALRDRPGGSAPRPRPVRPTRPAGSPRPAGGGPPPAGVRGDATGAMERPPQGPQGAARRAARWCRPGIRPGARRSAQGLPGQRLARRRGPAGHASPPGRIRGAAA